MKRSALCIVVLLMLSGLVGVESLVGPGDVPQAAFSKVYSEIYPLTVRVVGNGRSA